MRTAPPAIRRAESFPSPIGIRGQQVGAGGIRSVPGGPAPAADPVDDGADADAAVVGDHAGHLGGLFAIEHHVVDRGSSPAVRATVREPNSYPGARTSNCQSPDARSSTANRPSMSVAPRTLLRSPALVKPTARPPRSNEQRSLDRFAFAIDDSSVDRAGATQPDLDFVLDRDHAPIRTAQTVARSIGIEVDRLAGPSDRSA